MKPLTLNIIRDPKILPSISKNPPKIVPSVLKSEISSPLIKELKILPSLIKEARKFPSPINEDKFFVQPLILNIVPKISVTSDHSCYILKSSVSNRVYIGYTINFPRRIRQHNGEITGGAKRTKKYRPWNPICLIKGFFDESSAKRFEYRLQHPGRKRKAGEDAIIFTLQNMLDLIKSGDGSIAKQNKMLWPILSIQWYDNRFTINHPRVINYT